MLIDLIATNNLAIRFYHSEQDLSDFDGKKAAPRSDFSSSNLSNLMFFNWLEASRRGSS